MIVEVKEYNKKNTYHGLLMKFIHFYLNYY